MAECPFCKTEISDYANVCKSCGAEKGYIAKDGNIYGKSGTIIVGIIFPILAGTFLIFLAIGLFESKGLAIFLFIILMIPIVFSLYRLSSGPRWFRYSGPR